MNANPLILGTCFAKCPWSLRDAHPSQQDNELIVMPVVNKNGKALAYASNRLKDSIEVVLAAIKNDGMALFFASERLKKNEQVVLAAVFKDKNAIKCAHPDLFRK